MKTHPSKAIKRAATILLQIVIVLIGITVFAALLIEPQLEGRSANSSLFQTYFTDPFLVYIYLASIPFFVGLFQAFRGLGYMREGKIFSAAGVKAVRTIRYCALILIGSTIAATAYIRITADPTHEDPAGFVMLGLIIVLLCAAVASGAIRLERILRKKASLLTSR